MTHHDLRAPHRGRRPARADTHHRQGQLTVAIILGFLFLVIIASLMYQAGIITKEGTKKQLETQTMTQAKLTPVRDFIQGCLDLWTKEGVITLGQQGGYLFKGTLPGAVTQGQGGSMPDFLPSEAGGATARYIVDPVDSKKIIPYAIFKYENLCIPNWVCSDTPQYPFPTFPKERLEQDESAGTTPRFRYLPAYNFTGIYGNNLLPALDKPRVSPLPDFLNPQKNKPAIDSIQNMLETYILNHTLSCVDFSNLRSTNLEFKPDVPSINVTFTNGSVIASLHYPLTMKEKNTNVQLELAEWVSIVPVRMDYFFEVLSFAASYESSTMLFFMSNLSTPDNSITPSMQRNVKPGSNDYIVTYTDVNSRIDGKPYQFRFAVHNRPPALYYVNRTVIQPGIVPLKKGGNGPDPKLQPGPMAPLRASDVSGFTVCASKLPSGTSQPAVIQLINPPEGTMVQIDSAANCPDPKRIRIPLFAIDPDEDVATFSLKTQFSGFTTTTTQVSAGQTAFLSLNNKPLELTVSASDGSLSDTQTILFKTRCIPPAGGSCA